MIASTTPPQLVDPLLWLGTPQPATSLPSLTLVAPRRAQASGAAVIVCPGGGYVVHAEHEAEPVAAWLATLGITAFVLRYRLAPQHHHPAMLLDAARALRAVRHHAARWALDPQRIGVLGFSAGGHLAATLATHAAPGNPQAADLIESASARPDLAILVYPVITLRPPYGHEWCRECLLGTAPAERDVIALSAEARVTAQTPPCFLVHSLDDSGVPPEHSLLFAQALRAAAVPYELHLFESGGHGYGLAEDHQTVRAWPALCAAWLQQRGFCSPGL